MRTIFLIATLACANPVSAQSASAVPARIAFPSVAAALAELEARDGNGTIVTHSEGWTIINEPLASAQWSFAPSGHYAFPAVVRRTIRRAPDGLVAVETASLCEAPEVDCNKLLAEFSSLNGRITQAIKAGGRQGSTQPPQ